jgi:hypothetical protein
MVIHVLLDVDGDRLRERIHADEREWATEQWRLDHIDVYLDARPWLLIDADLVIDTSKNAADTVADEILRLLLRPWCLGVRTFSAGRCHGR